MAETKPGRRGIEIQIPGQSKPLRIERVVLDFNGTLTVDGKLVRGVAVRIRKVAARVDVAVLTADTFGTAHGALAGLPVTIHVVRNGAAKRRLVESLRRTSVATIGNGVNDVAMFEASALGIAVCGREGLATELVRVSAIMVHDVNDALDLLLRPRRLVATRRR